MEMSPKPQKNLHKLPKKKIQATFNQYLLSHILDPRDSFYGLLVILPNPTVQAKLTFPPTPTTQIDPPKGMPFYHIFLEMPLNKYQA